ncbi:hypothetical protein ACRAWG_10350 [Methylobacterium sp. P31]
MSEAGFRVGSGALCAPSIATAPLLGVEATRVMFGRTSAYRNLPGQEWGVPVWEFAARGN